MFRGAVHSKSSNHINALTQYVKFCRELARTEPLASDLGKEIEPGEAVQSDADIEDFIKQHPFSAYHTVGTCSMMLPLEKQGVVDPNLKVYGTENLRVVDVSIIPLHIAAHTQATAYAIGKKAADIIKFEM
ncbi:glucose-methanol-choline oxidoreductase [Agrocybe pediades]|nr:glucose-methanol-choline oxidoreductase [Agrocybe pediades]